jgi:hypothetical protein
MLTPRYEAAMAGMGAAGAVAVALGMEQTPLAKVQPWAAP